MTRSPAALARTALEVARQALPPHASKFSKRDFTQHQLVAMLALKQFFKTDDRGMVALLNDLAELRKILGLKKIPHHTTLFHAQKRLGEKGALTRCWMQSSIRLAEPS